MLECPKCQYDNDLGRIFCAKCGEKLEISKVGVPTGIKRRAKLGLKGQPLSKVLARAGVKLIKVTILAALAAFLTLTALPPKMDRQPFTELHIYGFEQKRHQLEQAIHNQEIVELVFEEGDLNAALAQGLQVSLQNEEESKGVKPESIHIDLANGTALVTVQNKWKWFRIFFQMQAKPEIKDNMWHFTPTAAWIGRFRIPSPLTGYMANAFSVIWKDLETERRWMEQFASMEIKPGQLIITTKREG